MNTARRVVLFVLASATAVALVDAAQAKVDVTGTWNFEVQTNAGGGSPVMSFRQDGEKITGHYTGTFGEADLTGTVKAHEITFSFSADFQGVSLTSTYKGTIENTTSMKGTVDISNVGSGTFTAKKK